MEPSGRVSCFRCGYDLRGLPAEGSCPECGLAVARSTVAGDALWHAPPGWLASLSWGARLVLLTPVAGYVYSALLPPGLRRVNSQEVSFGVPAALDVVFAAGIWLLTRPQPHRAETHRAWRWALRLVALAPLVETTSVRLLMAGRASVFWRIPEDLAMVALVPLLPALLFPHLRRLALRIPDRSLAEHCATVAVLGTVSFAAGAAVMFLRVGTVVEVTAGVGVILSLLWSLYLLVRFSVAFHRAHSASVASWGGGTGE